MPSVVHARRAAPQRLPAAVCEPGLGDVLPGGRCLVGAGRGREGCLPASSGGRAAPVVGVAHRVAGAAA
jgi:hypothetical protein